MPQERTQVWPGFNPPTRQSVGTFASDNQKPCEAPQVDHQVCKWCTRCRREVMEESIILHPHVSRADAERTWFYNPFPSPLPKICYLAWIIYPFRRHLILRVLHPHQIPHWPAHETRFSRRQSSFVWSFHNTFLPLLDKNLCGLDSWEHHASSHVQRWGPSCPLSKQTRSV